MAKINVEVEIDFIEEDYSLTENFKIEIKRKIQNMIMEKNIDKVGFELDEIQKKTVEREVRKRVTKFIKNFMKKDIVKTDAWGERMSQKSVEQKIKEELSDFTSRRVDKYGDRGNDYTYIEYLIKKMIQDTGIVENINEEGKKLVHSTFENLRKNNDAHVLKCLAEKILQDDNLRQFITK